jgi:hypothetical protein
LPALVLCYPRGGSVEGALWSAPLGTTAFEPLLNSPVRRELARRLLKGDSAVWLLIETGDPAKDTAAQHLLQARLEHLEKTLKLPKIEPEDAANLAAAPDGAGLKIAFSLLRVSRLDPAEALLVRMLLSSEEDLGDGQEPVAFPVFGRGHVLYALVGKGINPEIIDEACSYLIGPCSCVVKEENPGFDLLMSVNWEAQLSFQAVPHRETPDLTGLTAAAPRSNSAVSPPPAPAAPPAASSRTLALPLWGILALGLVVVAAGTFILRRPPR